MKLKTIKFLGLFLVMIILFGFIQLELNDPIGNTTNKDVNKDDFKIKKNPENQVLSTDNIYSGIGAPLNITHYSVREQNKTQVELSETDDSILYIPIGGEWVGQNSQLLIHNLYDTRNWCNGTFAFGSDNGYDNPQANDSADIRNTFQNWTFHSNDEGSNITYFSGNYNESVNGHDAIELRMNGATSNDGWSYWYNHDDRCGWETSFQIEAGKIIDATLNFDAFVEQTLDFNDWNIKFYLNNMLIYKVANYELEQACGAEDTWHSLSVPMELWINETNAFPSILNNSITTLNVSLEFVSGTTYHWGDLPGKAYQQFYLDNIELITKAETKPQKIDLRINDTAIISTDWGEALVDISGPWFNDVLLLNFSCLEDWILDDYQTEFLIDFNLTATISNPESNYESNYNSEGTVFSVINESKVEWEFFVYINELKDYKENLLEIEIPSDLNITEVYEPQYPSINRLIYCNNKTVGLFKVPVNNISSSPNGYWKFKGISPNYCEELKIYSNFSGIWTLNNTFSSGNYINLTGKIKPGLSYLDHTSAIFEIRFPNGSLWTTKTMLISPEIDGNINFGVLQIPESPPEYIAGEYEGIITWNNSYDSLGFNETGIIIKKFYIIHDSELITEQLDGYIGEVIQNKTTNIKCSYEDIDESPIENAQVYLVLESQKYFFSEISPGFYFFELNTSKLELGYNILSVFANSTYFRNKVINVSLNVVKESELDVETEKLSITIGSSVKFEANYTDKNGNHITGANIRIIDNDLDMFFTEDSLNQKYIFNLSTENREIGINLLTIKASSDSFVSQSDEIRLNVQRIQTRLALKGGGSKIESLLGENVNLQIVIEDVDFDTKITHAKVEYTWEFGNGELSEKGDGVYEKEFKDIPEGTYKITITVSAGEEYDFERYEITLNIVRPQQEVILFQILIIVGIIAIIGIASYTITYKKILKFPKQVRKVRKFRSSLKKRSSPTKEILQRESIIDSLYQKELGDFSKEVEIYNLNRKEVKQK